MKKSAFLTFLLFTAILLVPTSIIAASRGITVVSKKGQALGVYKDYQALVVGVGNYQMWPDLPSAVQDARDVAKTLKKLGFKVKTVLNPTSSELNRAIGDMVYRMGTEKNRGILFFYAGHGETESLADGTSMGYIIPTDCPLLKTNPMGFATHAVSMRDIESVSLRIRSKHVLMLFDSCFSGALFALVRAVPDDISEKSTLPVRQYITAGREDEQVPDHSMFKRCLLIGLEGDADLTGDGYVTGSELGMYLSDRVVNYTRGRQHPQYGKINNPSLDRGDFIFVPQKTLEKQAKEEQIQKEKASLLRDVEQLRKERAETRKLLEEMKRLMKEKAKAQEDIRIFEAEKKALQKKLTDLQKEKEVAKKSGLEKELEKLRQERKESEARFAESQKKIREEAARKKALEEELKRVREERKKAAAGKLAEAEKKTKESASVKIPAPAVSKVPEKKQRIVSASEPAVKKTAQSSASTQNLKPVKKMASLQVPEAEPVKETTLPEIETPGHGKGAATLIITSNKKGAEVYLDKKENSFWADPEEAWILRGKAPFRLDGISPGEHEIRVYLDNHDEELRTIHFKPGETVELHVPLFQAIVDSGSTGGGGA